MTARIRVVIDRCPACLPFVWWCTEDGESRVQVCGGGETDTIAEAANAGRAHLKRSHPDVVWAAGGRVYEAACGVRRDECGKAECTCQARAGAAESRSSGRVASVDPDDAGGRYSSVQRCEHCGHPVSEHYGQWCRHVTGAIKANGAKRICCCEGADSADLDNPINTAHNTSRGDC